MERATTGLGLVHNIMGIFSPRLKRSDCSQSPPPMNPNNESINITTIDNEIVHKLDDTLLTHSPPSSSSPVTEIDIPFCSIPLRLSSRFSNRRSLAAAREHRRSLKAPIAPQELVEKFVGLQDLKSSAFRRSKKFGEDGSKRTSEVWTVENKGRNTPDDDMDLLSLQPSSTSQDETVTVPPTTQPVPTETNDIPEVAPEPIRSDSINTRLMNETAPELWLLEPSEATSRWGPDAIKSRISVINTEGRPSEFWLLGPAAAPATRSDSVNVPVITNMSPPSKLTNKIENLPTTKLAEPIATQSKKRKDSPSEMLPPPKTRRLDKYLLPTENIKVTPDASVMTTQPVPIVKEAPIQRKNSRNNKPAASAPTKPKNIPKVYPLSVPKAERPKVLVRKTVPTLPLPRYKCPKEPVPSRPLIKTKRRAATDPQVKITRQPSIKKENIKSNDQVTLKRMLERTLMENAALKEEVELLKLENSKLKSDLSTKSAI